jgi:hypothetical protein
VGDWLFIEFRVADACTLSAFAGDEAGKRPLDIHHRSPWRG